MPESRSGARISVLLPGLWSGGAERLHLNLAREWQTRGLHVEFVLCRIEGQLLPLVPTGATLVDLKSPRFRRAFWPLVRYLRKSRADILLAAMWPLTVIAPLAARLARFGGTVVVSEHSILSQADANRRRLHRMLLSTSMRIAYPQAACRIAVSAGVADDLSALSGLPRSRFEVVYNAAATGMTYEQSAMPSALAGLARPVILGVGTLKPVKRFDLLIAAFALLLQRRKATLCILGDGSERKALEMQVAQLGLQGRVILPGFDVQTRPWYAHAALFVLSSDHEGFANVIVEAMEQGLPVVSTDCPAGPREILEGERYGHLVPVGGAQALADAMFNALAEQTDRNALRRRAQDFAADKIADQYLDLLLPGRRAGSASRPARASALHDRACSNLAEPSREAD